MTGLDYVALASVMLVVVSYIFRAIKP